MQLSIGTMSVSSDGFLNRYKPCSSEQHVFQEIMYFISLFSDHSDPDHSCSGCWQIYVERIILSMYDAPVNVFNYERYSLLH